MAKFLLWSNNDPNDSLEVEADTPENAALAALSELVWSMGAAGEPEPECEDCGAEMTDREAKDAIASHDRVICPDCIIDSDEDLDEAYDRAKRFFKLPPYDN